jgi:hypothetical protein
LKNPLQKRKAPPIGRCFSRVSRIYAWQKSVVSVAEAVVAVDGAIIVGLKGNLAGLTALGANSVEHLAGRSSTLTALCLAGIAAIAASLGLVGEALLCVELLISGGENEFASAILADNGLVSVHGIPLLFPCISCT